MKGNYVLSFDDKYKISGDDFYRDSDGTPVVPWGTLTIEETKAPDGYKIKDSTVSVNGQVIVFISQESVIKMVNSHPK